MHAQLPFSSLTHAFATGARSLREMDEGSYTIATSFDADGTSPTSKRDPTAAWQFTVKGEMKEVKIFCSLTKVEVHLNGGIVCGSGISLFGGDDADDKRKVRKV